MQIYEKHVHPSRQIKHMSLLASFVIVQFYQHSITQFIEILIGFVICCYRCYVAVTIAIALVQQRVRFAVFTLPMDLIFQNVSLHRGQNAF